MEWWPFILFIAVALTLLLGYPVAFTLGGVALLVALLASAVGAFELGLLQALPNRLFGIMTNQTLMAVPLFVFMGALLERSKVADDLLNAMSLLAGRLPGGLGLAVVLMGALMAASTGIVGATVVTMGLLALPSMLRQGYDPAFSCGVICASGTLGQIIPPSIVLVLLGDVLANAYQQAQLSQGIFQPDTVSVGDLFAGALLPGLLLVAAYGAYVLWYTWRRPPATPQQVSESASMALILRGLLPPLLLILAVLGAILTGFTTPTEAAAIGAVGSVLIALVMGRFKFPLLWQALLNTVKVTAMVFMIFIGASIFSLVFRGFGGDELVHGFFEQLPGGVLTAMLLVMLVTFLLGFILDFIEITFVVVPIVAPVLMAMGVDPVWLGVMFALNLQTSFLTPPFGFALFYLRGVVPETVTTRHLYQGVWPFIVLQVGLLLLLACWPSLATWLPEQLYG